MIYWFVAVFGAGFYFGVRWKSNQPIKITIRRGRNGR